MPTMPAKGCLRASLPGLLARGCAGKVLVFGYGRAWFAVGDDLGDARRRLAKRHPFHLPHVVYDFIDAARTNLPHRVEYYRWKKRRPPLAPAVWTESAMAENFMRWRRGCEDSPGF